MTPEIKRRIEQLQHGEVPEGYKKTKVGIVPYEWKLYRLSEITAELHECAGEGNYETLSISAGIGFVNQANKFGKEISGAQYSKYTVLKKGDFSYNKGNSKKYPQGCIYQLKDRDAAAVPNVFESFRLTKGHNDYFEQLFMHGFLNSQLFSKINHGVRDDGLLNLRGNDFYSSYVLFPSLVEQEKIAQILSTQDKLILLKEKLVEEKKRQKKALMQQLLTGKKHLPGFTREWVDVRLGDVFKERVETNCQDLQLLSVTGINGVVPRSTIETKDNSSEDKSKYLKICKGDIGYNTMRMWQGVSALSELEGIVSPAYTILIPSEAISAKYFSYLFKMHAVIFLFYRFSQGIVDDTRSLKYYEFAKLHLNVPLDKQEQGAIAAILATADKEIEVLQKDLDQEKQKKKALMQLLLTGIVRV